MAVPDGAPAQAVGLPGAERVPPLVLVLTGIASVQVGAALSAKIFDDVGPAGASLLRIAFAALILGVAVRPRVPGRDPRHLRLAALFGLALGAMNLSFYEALDRLPLGVAVTIEFVGPLGVAVVASRRRLDLLWAALAAIGIVLLSDPFGAGGIDGAGFVLALVAGGCWALYILLAQRAGRVFPGADAIAIAMVVAALVPLAPGLAQGGTTLVHPQFLAIGLGVALLSSVIPYTLELEALRRLPANVFGVLMSLEPAAAALVGLLVLGQGLGVLDVVAIALVVAAGAGVSLAAPRPSAADVEQPAAV